MSGGARKELGAAGERLAARALAERGLTVVQANYRCAAGEMDLIARAPDEWVFVEVKTRRGRRFGAPEDAVNGRKQRKLVEVAETYLQEHGLDDARWRIDVVAVEMDTRGRLLRLEVIENAVSRQG
ncbi:MAG: YraN family protein [Chloroflexi bacterium]|nr:YraN family protein [Chloroflexota bacterium]